MTRRLVELHNYRVTTLYDEKPAGRLIHSKGPLPGIGLNSAHVGRAR